jgi:hypothetical protein
MQKHDQERKLAKGSMAAAHGVRGWGDNAAVAAPPYKGPEFVKLILHFTML